MPQFSEYFQLKIRFSKIALLQATDEFLIFRAIAEHKSFGFSCVAVGQQYSLNFILVSYFHFEMFRIMADIFLLAAVCVFSFFPFVFFVNLYFAFLNKIIILNSYRNLFDENECFIEIIVVFSFQ